MGTLPQTSYSFLVYPSQFTVNSESFPLQLVKSAFSQACRCQIRRMSFLSGFQSTSLLALHVLLIPCFMHAVPPTSLLSSSVHLGHFLLAVAAYGTIMKSRRKRRAEKQCENERVNHTSAQKEQSRVLNL
ncbi:hypothetical protein TWF173_002911 [Orbilia oligospora]|nr:hypothetical protein TWF173_002911 [Orbilia oligospora]